MIVWGSDEKAIPGMKKALLYSFLHRRGLRVAEGTQRAGNASALSAVNSQASAVNVSATCPHYFF
jgi:hypothetical protein